MPGVGKTLRPEGEAANGWGMSLVGKGRGHVEIPKPQELEPRGWRESSWEDGEVGRAQATRGILGRAMKVLGGLGEWNDVEFSPEQSFWLLCGKPIQQLRSPHCLKMQTPCIPPDCSVSAPLTPSLVRGSVTSRHVPLFLIF